MRTIYQEGFTAVELLITLFIAAVFLFAGYQLYTQVNKESADADKTAKVSNVGYELLRTKVADITAAYPDGCVNASISPQPANIVQTIAGVGSVTFVTTISCPQGVSSSTDLFYVRVVGSFSSGGATRTVTHATYAN